MHMLGMKAPRALALVAAMLAVLAIAIAAVACGSQEPAEIDEAQLSRIVSQAVAESQPAPQPQVSVGRHTEDGRWQAMAWDVAEGQVSADQIQAMVQDAVAGAAQEGASAAEIQKMVESAVMAATADSDDQRGRPVCHLEGRHGGAG